LLHRAGGRAGLTLLLLASRPNRAEAIAAFLIFTQVPLLNGTAFDGIQPDHHGYLDRAAGRAASARFAALAYDMIYWKRRVEHCAKGIT
jgi:hypothetical protein